jgi:membrane protein DedA with SNARE-associated domain
MDLPVWLIQAIDTFGYPVVFLAIAIESTGIPFPGETALVGAAIYAGTGRGLNIVLVIACCAAGAIVGDNLGYAVGRFGGYPLLRKLLRALHLKETTLGVTQRYFEQHGDKTVFIGRFFAILRCWAAFLAGVNQMPWRTFLFWNAAGGIIWATIFGTLGYALGNNLPLLGRVLSTLGIVGGVVATVAIVGLLVAWFVHHRRSAARAVAKLAGSPTAMEGPTVRRRVSVPRRRA